MTKGLIELQRGVSTVGRSDLAESIRTLDRGLWDDPLMDPETQVPFTSTAAIFLSFVDVEQQASIYQLVSRCSAPCSHFTHKNSRTVGFSYVYSNTRISSSNSSVRPKPSPTPTSQIRRPIVKAGPQSKCSQIHILVHSSRVRAHIVHSNPFF